MHFHQSMNFAIGIHQSNTFADVSEDKHDYQSISKSVVEVE